MNFTSKLPSVGTTIFTVMSQMATEYNAVNLGQGFPDFMMSEELMGGGAHRVYLRAMNCVRDLL
jgi:methionine aminotransferase